MLLEEKSGDHEPRLGLYQIKCQSLKYRYTVSWHKWKVLLVVGETKSLDHQSCWNISSRDLEYLFVNYMANHLIVVKVFHIEPQTWTSWWHKRKFQWFTKVSSSLKSVGLILYGTECLYSICLVVVEIFQSAPKWWTDCAKICCLGIN